MSKILLLGPLTNKYDPSKTGGIVILFALLIDEIKAKNIDFEIIDTLVENHRNSLVTFFSVLSQLVRKIHKYDHVSLQATTNSFIFIGPLLIILAKIFSKKTSIRKFAGSFDTVYENSGFIKKHLIEFVLKNTDVNFFETKYLVEYFKKFNSHTYWMPNVRQRKLEAKKSRSFHKRFVYIGTINKEKGIDEIVEVSKKLNKNYTLDLYGPIFEKKYSIEYFKEKNVNYKGALISSEVISVVNSYDVLILPSYREGYPGVIIEAFSLGIPVIATKLDGIMEMVEDHKNGLLIDVKSSDQLFNAIMSFDKIDYSLLSYNALESFDYFNSFKQTEQFLSRIGFNNLKGEVDEYR